MAALYLHIKYTYRFARFRSVGGNIIKNFFDVNQQKDRKKCLEMGEKLTQMNINSAEEPPLDLLVHSLLRW